ncbi:family 16 glycoside hydrolase [Planctomicrobium sp. SH664]|uniref:family 16 glycoside hydrolase n=1 Tax=Planctomicrobium sp. SH664 TaxID=3448125 RepID=UPI003F5C6ECA
MSLTHLCRLGVCLLLLSGLVLAGDPERPKGTVEWKPLIAKDSLKNWKLSSFGGDGRITVKEGVMSLGEGKPLTGVHWQGPAFPKANYEIALEAKRIKGADFFLGLTFPVKEENCTLVLGGWGGGVVGLSSIDGFDASENETSDYVRFEDDHWYKVKLQVTDTHILAWLDDKQIADVDYTERTIGLRIEMELCKPLGLATYQTEGAVRDLKYRELTPEKAKEKAKQ